MDNTQDIDTLVNDYIKSLKANDIIIRIYSTFLYSNQYPDLFDPWLLKFLRSIRSKSQHPNFKGLSDNQQLSFEKAEAIKISNQHLFKPNGFDLKNLISQPNRQLFKKK